MARLHLQPFPSSQPKDFSDFSEVSDALVRIFVCHEESRLHCAMQSRTVLSTHASDGLSKQLLTIEVRKDAADSMEAAAALTSMYDARDAESSR